MGHVRPPRPHRLGRPGPVFLGEELIHTRDYSDETYIIDEEVTRMLDQQAPGRHRGSPTCAQLGALAAALLEHETLDATDITEILAGTPTDENAAGHVDVGSADAALGDAMAGRRTA